MPSGIAAIKTILLVEDDPFVMSAFLSDRFFNPSVATSGHISGG
jgi:hypothetical protein